MSETPKKKFPVELKQLLLQKNTAIPKRNETYQGKELAGPMSPEDMLKELQLNNRKKDDL